MGTKYLFQKSQQIYRRLVDNWKKPIPIKEIADVLSSLGIKRGDDLLVHSAFSKFYHGGDISLSRYYYRLTPEAHLNYAQEIIRMFLDFAGDTGTLLFPGDFIRGHYFVSSRKLWSLKDAPTAGRGILTETFRRWPGVMRSTHPIYNILAYGPGIEEEIANHWDLLYTQDVGSPWYNFKERGGKVVFFGADYSANSSIHMPEYVLKQDYPRPVFFNKPHKFLVENMEGVQKKVSAYVMNIQSSQHAEASFKHAKYLNAKYGGIYQTMKVRDIPIIVFRLKDQFDAQMQELQEGHSWYDAFLHWD